MSDPKPPLRRWPGRLALAVVAVLAVVGPWPVDDAPFDGSADQASTLDRLDASPARAVAGPIRIGLAEADLTPSSPRPLAGFIGQVRTPYVGVDSPCLARALTVESGGEARTILAADLLLIDARMARAVRDRAGVGPDEVFFTASHTHGGPGGWGAHPLEMLVAGAYDPAYFDELAGRLADVVRRSRARLEPAELAFVQVQAKGRQSNRVERGSTTHDALSAWSFRAPGGSGPLALLVVFGAHATVSHPVPPRLGGDYPAALASALARRTGARSVLFAAGAVGDASPARIKAASPAESAEALGSALADDLMAALPSARYEANPSVGALRLDVDLPPVRLPFVAPWLRFSPLATWWIADRRTHLHALRLGPAALVGFPGDYSGHLADRLAASGRAGSLMAVATSFDGDYRGYLVSGRVFRDVPCYETRWMSFFGPWAGDYLTDMAKRMLDRLGDSPPPPARPAPLGGDDVPRLILGAVLVLSAFGGRGRLGVARRAGFATVAVALGTLVAFEVAPGAVAWARFGLPDWARLAGAIPAAAGLVLGSRGRPGRGALLLGLGSGVLAGSWPVFLMLARGGAKWGLSGPSTASSASSAN